MGTQNDKIEIEQAKLKKALFKLKRFLFYFQDSICGIRFFPLLLAL